MALTAATLPSLRLKSPIVIIDASSGELPLILLRPPLTLPILPQIDSIRLAKELSTMHQMMKEPHRNLIIESTIFALTLLLGILLCLLLSSSMPAQKRMIDYLAQGVFSAFLAVPAGAAWRSLQRVWLVKR